MVQRKEEEKQKLRIRIRGYDHKIIDSSVRQIVETVTRYGAEIVGPCRYQRRYANTR